LPGQEYHPQRLQQHVDANESHKFIVRGILCVLPRIRSSNKKIHRDPFGGQQQYRYPYLTSSTIATSTCLFVSKQHHEPSNQANKQVKTTKWKSTFARLLAYKKEHGTANVPLKYNDGGSPHLGGWTYNLKRRHKNGSLSQEWIDQLESIGFEWKLPKMKTSKTKQWAEMLERLVAYMQEYGNTEVPNNYNDGGRPDLGRWVQTQKASYIDGSLSQEMIDQLDSIGFVSQQPTTTRSRKWTKAFERLIAYKKEHGNTNVPCRYNDGGSPHLGEWANNQRFRYSNGLLQQERIDQLESIGFAWKSELKTEWTNAFERLVAYKKVHGNTIVPVKYNDGGRPSLGQWVITQRHFYRDFETRGETVGLTFKDRFDKLNDIGFVWDLGSDLQYDVPWLAQFENLTAFQRHYNSTRVPILSYGCDDPITRLGVWVSFQIEDYRKYLANKTSTMTPEKINKLNKIGFSWTRRKDDDHDMWLDMYFKLYLHYKLYNSTSVSEADGHSTKLVQWVKQQKQLFNKSMLTKQRTRLLNEIEFDWTIDPPPSWDDMYKQLVSYHDKFHSTLVPPIVNKELGRWTQQQRKGYMNGSIDKDKRDRLDRIKFDWNAVDVNWNAMADRLATFQQKYNSTNVPQAYGEDPPLGLWVKHQRAVYGKYFSSVDTFDDDLLWTVATGLQSERVPAGTHVARIQRLIDIGLVWDPFEGRWMEMYNRLVAYKEEHNSTVVPQKNSWDPELGAWVDVQRRGRYDMSDQRIALLNRVGFEWDPNDTKWNEMYERLLTYKVVNGSTRVLCTYDKDPSLGQWVLTQRALRKQRRLTMERIDRLDSAGFIWSVQGDGQDNNDVD
jgi:hypothetical protein